MFLRNDIVEFINKIINAENIKKDEMENNIKEFYKYLKLTKMADEKTLEFVDKVVDCLPQILVLKEKLGTFDISMFLNDEEKTNKNTSKRNNKKTTVKENEEKHYQHYHETKPDNVTSNCGSGPTYTYSSSCGGSIVSRSGC